MFASEKIKKTTPYFILLLYAMIAFWSVAVFRESFKWDMVSYYFPLRYYVSECIRSGHFPLWLPYQSCGFPVYGDPQSGAWYPVVWIISFVHGYDIYGASVEFMFTIFIAGSGFYLLARGLNISRPFALLTAASYMSCGFFVGNAQHLALLISAAYIPFVIHFYLRLLNELNFKDALATALFLFLMLTGGYPAHFIILFYLLLVFFLVKLSGIFIRREEYRLKKIIPLQVFLVVVFLLCGTITIVSWMQCMPFTTRGAPLLLNDIFVYAFTPQSFLSFINPFALQRRTEFFDTDLSMSNGYFGIFCLLFLFYFLLRPKTRWQYFFLGLSVFFLLASLGRATPVREWLYRFVPMMNYFRYPSIFRIFFILLFLLLAGFAMDNFINRFIEERKKLASVSTIAILLFFVLIIIAVNRNYSSTSAVEAFRNWQSFLSKSTVYDHIIFQSAIQFAFLALLFLALLFVKSPRIFTSLLVFLSFSDMLIATRLNMDFTVVTTGLTPKSIAENINMLPKNFPAPDSKLLREHNYAQLMSPLWQNLNIFGKQITCDGYGPFTLRNYQTLLDKPWAEKIFQNKSCHLAENIFAYSSLMDSAEIEVRAQDAYLDENNFFKLKNLAGHVDETEGCRFLILEPDRMVIEVDAKQNRLLMVMQNNFPGWTAKVNGSEVDLISVNYSLMAIPVRQGKNSVELFFKPVFMHAAFFISVISLLFVVAALFFRRRNT